MEDLDLILPWHREIVGRILALMDADQLPNAIALTAADGWGNTALLKAVSNALLGVSMATDTSELAHPDLRWIVPDGAMIKVEQVRRINDFAVQTPQIASRKVAAIDAAHLLNANAANALLKTLEEPPPNTHLLLATTRWGKLLPTIRSRCQRFQHGQSPEVARSWLDQEGISVSDLEFAELGHAPINVVDGQNTDFQGWLRHLRSVDLAVLINQTKDVDLVAWLSRWYRSLLQIAAAASSAGQRRDDLFSFCDELIEIRRQIETSNSANTRLLLERLIVLWRKLPMKDDHYRTLVLSESGSVHGLE